MSDRRAFSVGVYARREIQGHVEVLIIHHHRLQTWLPVGGELEPGETPLEAAIRELREETGLVGQFPVIEGAPEGVPPGYLGYEEHQAGSKGLHMNFVFVANVPAQATITPNDEFERYRWVGTDQIDGVESPLNVREFAFLALAARSVV